MLRRLLTGCLILSAGIPILSAAETAPRPDTPRPDAPRPNIVIVMADDMGWSDVGCYGGEIKTPHIDSLATAGMRFTRFYNNAICGPTRASLLTGLYCQQVGHRGDRWNEPKDFNKCVTIAEALQQSDYRTMMVGKWQGRDLAVQRGFNRFFGPMCQGMVSYYHEVHANPFYADAHRWTFPKNEFFMTDAFSDRAVRFVDEAATQKKPFFLYVAYLAPHWPLHAQEADIARHRKTYRQHGWDYWRERRFARQKEMGLIPSGWRLSPSPASIPSWENDRYKDWQAERMAVYAAQVSAVDRGVGNILDALHRHGIERNTLVMFLSDNGAAPDGGVAPSTGGFGFHPGAHKNKKWYRNGLAVRPGSGPNVMPGPPDTFSGYGLAWANLSNTPLRGSKLEAWEGGIRTPLIVRWPAVIRKGNQITRQPGHVIDFLATCLDVAGGTYPKKLGDRRPLPLEGKSLMPIFRGEQRPGHKTICWSVPRNQAICMGRWKLVNRSRNKAWELYDLETDGTETTNLAGRYPERVQQMAARFKEWHKRVGAHGD